MCRLLALAGSGFAAQVWLDALRRVARRDPVLESMGRRDPSHGDGWGVAALLGSGPAGQVGLIHYRSSQPIWEDSALEPVASLVSAPALLVAHARKASEGMPRGVGAAHPFPLHTSDGGSLFVAQNGEVTVERIPAVPDSAKAGGLVDSFVYALALAKLLEDGYDLLGALSELHRALARRGGVRRMANTAALLVRRAGSQWSAQLGVVRHLADSGIERYGELYICRERGFTAVASSSLAVAMDCMGWEAVGGNAVGVLGLERLEGRWESLE